MKLENALAAVCSAVIHADDTALNERTSQGMGDVYLDATLSTSRRPRWLRRSMQEVATNYNLPLMPPQTYWHKKDIVEELDKECA